MNKKITILGSIILGLAIISMVLFNFMDVMASTEGDTGTISNIHNNNQQLIFGVTDTQHISGIYSSITVIFNIRPNSANQEFNISIWLKFPTGIILNGCNNPPNDLNPCIVSSKIVSLSNEQQTSLQAFENRAPIAVPIIISGNGIPSNIPREYYISVSSPNSIDYDYRAIVRSRIGPYIDMPLFIIGVAVLGFGLVKAESGGRVKPMKARSWQEPTLGGSSSPRSSKGSSRFSKGSGSQNNGATQSKKVPTAVNCKKCGGVMPRNSQYCPHCYTRQ